MTSIHDLYVATHRIPIIGSVVFDLGVRLRAPYFGTISPHVTSLQPGRCEVSIRDRRRVHNHIGSVHAIACCNMAELAAGLMTDVTIPEGYRWIPAGMQVRYLARATGSLKAIATAASEAEITSSTVEWPVAVTIFDSSEVPVVKAEVSMHVSRRNHAGGNTEGREK